MTKKKFIKIVSCYLAFNLLAQVCWPTAAFALTSGPSQPEVQSFEPVGTTQMVDPFTGDFNYNIPLLTVPGPNGGYPINMSYHAGIGMEQEASWVGLGWNLNPGALNREMRGLPDDLNGEIVKKTQSSKPAITLGLAWEGATSEEIFGITPYDLGLQLDAGVQMYWNNYRGVGIGFDVGLSKIKTKSVLNHLGVKGYGFSLSLDPQNGAGVAPSISLSNKLTGQNRKFDIGCGYNTREGVYKLGLSISNLGPSRYKTGGSGGGTGISFCGSTYVPGISTPTFGMSFNFYNKWGTAACGKFTLNSLRIFGSWNDVKDKSIEMPGYGYIYTDQRINSSTDPMLMDFNRENEVPITNDGPYLPVPTFTNDIFTATGQGIGMDFRPYRSDIGVLYDPRSSSENVQVTVGGEVGPAGHSGVNVQAGFTRSYSGKWNNNNDWDQINTEYEFQKMMTSNEGTYEPFYFKSGNEMVATNSEDDRYSGEGAERFNINMAWAPEGAILSFKPKVKNKRYSDGKDYLTRNIRSERDRRASNIEYRTLAQLQYSNVEPQEYKVAAVNTFPGRSSITSTAMDYSGCEGYGASSSQIGEYSILGTDGMRYAYAIPAYNTHQKEVAFSVAQQTSDYNSIPYSSTQASTDNGDGRDHYYSSTELPPYAYSYLLTAVYSPDYVDLTGDGPTEDDLGYYTKFNYNKTSSTYKWRSPYIDANYIPGYDSDAQDDKASYVFGEKEIWYLNSVETKTHIAEFYVSDRHDARGDSLENQLTSSPLGQSQKKLDKIVLYSKADRSNPIKTVEFEYNYSLCVGVPNNSVNTPTSLTEGKLTLKKLWFTSQNNSKGKLTPYEFYYREDQSDYNPNYNLLQMDRWGYYKPGRLPSNSLPVNTDDPYVDQTNKANQDKYMSAWNLYQVTLPSGGIITVDYESDDYAYVQDYSVTQMCKIDHTGSEDYTSSTENRLYDTHGSGGTKILNRIYFDLNTPTNSRAELDKYVAGIDKMYFKTYLHLKRYQDDTGDWHEANDYVDGFCEIVQDDDPYDTDYTYDFDASSLSSGLYSRAYVTVKTVPVKQTENSAGQTHPFSKAAWEYMKVHRPDLLYQSMPINTDASALRNVVAQLGSIGASYFRNVSQFVLGYYTSCQSLGFAGNFEPDTYHPSFIRLNAPDHKKLGGGHRVKSIRVSDNWNKITTDEINRTGSSATPEDEYGDYGVEYTYTTVDGWSSGVASYEPLIGGEENPMRLPTDRFSSSRTFLHNSRDLYLVLPIGESYYPAPVVGYSRVIIKNIKHIDSENTELNKTTSPGITVMQYYTSRDFPVKVSSTDIDDCHYSPDIHIPFVGSFGYDNHGYSQGYTVHLNDMNGKLKSVSTYAYLMDPTDPMFDSEYETRVFYKYQTTTEYNPDGENKLFNLVNVMDDEGNYRYAVMGQSSEFFIDMMQHSGFTLDVGAQINVESCPPACMVFPLPMVDYSEMMFRSIVAMKVVQQKGILIEVQSTKNGATTYTDNLMFDGYSGQPVLTSATNDHDDPVYSYGYAAHWAYNGMGPAYKNYGLTILNDVTINGSNQYSFTGTNSNYTDFNVGDMVDVELSGGAHLNCWVNVIGNNYIKLIDESGTLLPSSTIVYGLRVLRSACTNQLSSGNGSIVSLSNPVTERNFPLFSALNANLADERESTTSISFEDCATQTNHTANVTYHSGYIDFDDGDDCLATLTLPTELNGDITSSTVRNYRFTKRGQQVSIELIGTPSQFFTATWSDPKNCFPECLDNVLHADATRFASTWTYNYSDVATTAGVPQATSHNYSGTSSGNLSSFVSGNGYRFGTNGIWKTESNYLYQTDRKQGKPEDAVSNITNIRRDGTYDNFVLYNWAVSAANNPQWTYASSVTKYSPYGYEVENKDALDHYSCALYGYNNSTVTSVIQNSCYFESGFDGFEDYAGTYINPGRTHLNLAYVSSGAPSLYSSDAHTGKTSAVLSGTIQYASIPIVTAGSPSFNPATPQTAFSFVAGKTYSVSAWFKTNSSGAIPQLTVTNSTNVTTDILPQKIEGWQRVETTFTVNASGTVTIQFGLSSSGTGWLDDIRIQPFNSAMKTYVYDPVTLWLVAELDNRNFATLYNYDEEGTLVQVKQETEKGIATIKTSRNNLYQH
jgi:hypothetical protein